MIVTRAGRVGLLGCLLVALLTHSSSAQNAYETFLRYRLPNAPIVPRTVADCTAFFNEGRNVIEKIRLDKEECVGKNFGKAIGYSEGPCCWAAFGGQVKAGEACTTHRECQAVGTEFWCKSQQLQSEVNECLEKVRISQLFEKREPTTDDQKYLDAFLDVVRNFAKNKSVGLPQIAQQNIDRASRAGENALDEYLKAIAAATPKPTPTPTPPSAPSRPAERDTSEAPVDVRNTNWACTMAMGGRSFRAEVSFQVSTLTISSGGWEFCNQDDRLPFQQQGGKIRFYCSVPSPRVQEAVVTPSRMSILQLANYDRRPRPPADLFSIPPGARQADEVFCGRSR